MIKLFFTMFFFGLHLQQIWAMSEAEINSQFMQFDAELGFSVVPSKKTRAKLVSNDKNAPVYDVIYTSDQYGRRANFTDEKASRFALFFGCSLVWGVGVNDDQTLPFFFSRLAQGYSVYNYGIPGSGPHQLLALLSNRTIRTEVRPEEGLGIYLYTSGHMMRAIGAAVEMQWLHQSPYYYLNEKGELIRNKSFSDGRALTTTLYRIIGKSGILRKLQRNIPRLGPSHRELTCKIITEVKNKFKLQFPKGHFFTILLGNEDEADLVSCLSKHHVKHFLLPLSFNLSAHSGEKAFLPDGHFSPYANKSLAESIYFMLSKLNYIKR